MSTETVLPGATFGRRLTYLRHCRQMTMVAAAKLAGAHINTWRSWERDETTPKIDHLRGIDAALDLHDGELAWLVRGED